MSCELLHVLEHLDGLDPRDGWKVFEKFRQRPAAFEVVEQCPNRHTRSDEDRGSPEDVGV